MDRVLILKPILNKISDGQFFKLAFSWLFRAFAVIMILGILFVSWGLWKNLSSGSSINIFIAALLVEVLLLFVAFVVFNILWIRSNDILAIPKARDYTVTPIIVIIIKVMGEVFASIFIILGFAVSLSTWFGGAQLMRSMPSEIPLAGMITTGGAFAFVFGTFLGFFTLAFCYAAGEASGALVDIARNTKKGK